MLSLPVDHAAAFRSWPYAWLDDLAGKGCYAIHSDTLPGIDAIAIYLEEPELVRVMVETFELELASLP